MLSARFGQGVSRGGGRSYRTNFDLNETPISEGGLWTGNGAAVGLDWCNVNTSSGLAFGTQTGSGAFDDSHAYLVGFPPNVYASAVVRRSGTFNPATTREVELLFRWKDSAHNARGYEVTFPYDATYSGIVRWDGPLATGEGAGFTTLLAGPTGWGALADGDVVSALMQGTLLTAWVRGVQLMQLDVATGAGASTVFTDGGPGIGFWRGGPATGTDSDSDLCFTSYAAVAQ